MPGGRPCIPPTLIKAPTAAFGPVVPRHGSVPTRRSVSWPFVSGLLMDVGVAAAQACSVREGTEDKDYQPFSARGKGGSKSKPFSARGKGGSKSGDPDAESFGCGGSA